MFMKIKEGFILRKVAEKYVVVAVGPASKVLNGMIKLNETGVLCWQHLTKGTDKEELVKVLAAEYGLSKAQAETDVSAFLDTLREVGCLHED